MQNAINILKGLLTKITDVGKKAISEGIKQIEDVVNKALNKINDIIKKAEETGLDIKSCMNLVKKLQQLPKELILNEITCVTTEMETATKIVNETISAVIDVYDQITKFPTRLQDCLKDPLPAIKCVAGVIADMLKLEQTAPAEIDKLVRAAIDFVTGFEERVQHCAIDQVNNAKNESVKIVNDMKECIANLTTKAY